MIFAQGEPCTSVLYIQSGTVKLSVLPRSGKEAVAAKLGFIEYTGGLTINSALMSVVLHE